MGGGGEGCHIPSVSGWNNPVWASPIDYTAYLTQTVILIYKSLILSKLTYGGIVCWSAPVKELGKFQKLQHRALRICYKSDRYTSNLTLHGNAGLHTLHLRRKLELYKIMYSKTRTQTNDNGESVNLEISTRYGSSNPASFVRPKSSAS